MDKTNRKTEIQTIEVFTMKICLIPGFNGQGQSPSPFSLSFTINVTLHADALLTKIVIFGYIEWGLSY